MFFPLFRFDSSAVGQNRVSGVVNTFTTIGKARIWTAIVLNGLMGKHMLDVYPGMKRPKSTMLSSLKGVEYIGSIKFITMREAGPLTISTPPRRSMQAMAYGRRYRNRREYVSGVRRLEQVVELNQLCCMPSP